MFNQKDLLAKLLATEDVTVLHAEAKTASFDVKNRVLTLPVWNDMTDETYDHLTGHEVGHALYTPADGWGKELDKGLGNGFKSFLNVVEDARIEKLIQRRYPGLRRSFIKSYKKMLSDGFFGGDIEKLNTFPIIDRINTFFKAGPTAGVRIERDEQVWIDEIEKLETWDEVVDVATRLYAYAKAKKDEESEQELNDFEDASVGDDEDGEYETVDADEDGEDGKTDGEDVDGDGEGKSYGNGIGDENFDDVESLTDKSLNENINSNYNNDSGIKVKNLMMNVTDVKPLIVDYKTIITDFDEYDTKLNATNEQYRWNGDDMTMGSRGEDLFIKFMANNKKAISYLTKEFEMKKSANDYVRATTSKTGVIDPIKMNSYLYNDDIFKKVTTVPEGKSHGMIMYLDWSGSMNGDMKATVDQLLNLVHFCRNVNIPFRVYAFTSGYDSQSVDGLTKEFVDLDTLWYADSFRFLEFFNSKMNKKDFITMSKYLLALGEDTQASPFKYHLHSTPLDAAIMGANSLHELFLKNHRVDIVNTIFLTDGESHPMFFETELERGYGPGEKYKITANINDLNGWRFEGQVNIIDPLSKKRYPLGDTQRQEITELLLKMYRERTGSTTIGFRILPNKAGSIARELRYLRFSINFKDLASKMRKDKYCVIPSTGYTKYFGIGSGKDLATANGSFEVTGNETKVQLRNAFKLASKTKVTSRALLNEFVKEVA